MTARLAHIFRHPVKSVGGEALDEVRLTEGQPLPGDRRFAVLHQAALHHLDGGRLRKWLPKSAFVRGAAAAPLHAVKGGWDGAALHLTHPDLPDLRFDPMAEPEALAFADMAGDLGEYPGNGVELARPVGLLVRPCQPDTFLLRPFGGHDELRGGNGATGH